MFYTDVLAKKPTFIFKGGNGGSTQFTMPFAGSVSVNRKPGSYKLTTVFGLDIWVSNDSYSNFSGDAFAMPWMAKPASAVQATTELMRARFTYVVNTQSVRADALRVLSERKTDPAESEDKTTIELDVLLLRPAGEWTEPVEVTVHFDPVIFIPKEKKRRSGDVVVGNAAATPYGSAAVVLDLQSTVQEEVRQKEAEEAMQRMANGCTEPPDKEVPGKKKSKLFDTKHLMK